MREEAVMLIEKGEFLPARFWNRPKSAMSGKDLCSFTHDQCSTKGGLKIAAPFLAGVGKLIDGDVPPRRPTPEEVERFQEHRKECFEAQVDVTFARTEIRLALCYEEMRSTPKSQYFCVPHRHNSLTRGKTQQTERHPSKEVSVDVSSRATLHATLCTVTTQNDFCSESSLVVL